jgi:hypothetical protein
VEWTLVVPCTLTPSERAFVDKLAEGTVVKVSVMERPALDAGFAAHPDLEASFTRDQLREAARDYNQEKALLLSGEDLLERVRSLGGRADNLDPHWTWDFERRGDLVVQPLRGKHPLAQQASPIRVHLTARPEAISDDLNAAITRKAGLRNRRGSGSAPRGSGPGPWHRTGSRLERNDHRAPCRHLRHPPSRPPHRAARAHQTPFDGSYVAEPLSRMPAMPRAAADRCGSGHGEEDLQGLHVCFSLQAGQKPNDNGAHRLRGGDPPHGHHQPLDDFL